VSDQRPEPRAQAWFGGLAIGRVLGVPLVVSPFWLLLVVVFTFGYAPVIRDSVPQLTQTQSYLVSLGFVLLLYGSVLIHEMSHVAVAKALGMQVQRIVLQLLGGVSEIVEERPGSARREYLVAIAGPMASLLLAAIGYGVRPAFTDGSIPRLFVDSFAWTNLIVAIFNALPGLPLDGGRMLQSVVWRVTHDQQKATRIAARSGLVVGGAVIAFAIYALTQEQVFQAVWGGIIGLFIFRGAQASEQRIGIDGRLASATVAEAMDPPPPSVPADLSLSLTLDRFLRGHEEEAFPVIQDGEVIGMISFNSARELGIRDPLRPARDALIPLEHVLVAHPDERLDEVSARLGTDRAALVLRDGRLVGAISGSGVYRWAARAS
jgi:Zn-dependent protease